MTTDLRRRLNKWRGDFLNILIEKHEKKMKKKEFKKDEDVNKKKCRWNI